VKRRPVQKKAWPGESESQKCKTKATTLANARGGERVWGCRVEGKLRGYTLNVGGLLPIPRKNAPALEFRATSRRGGGGNFLKRRMALSAGKSFRNGVPPGANSRAKRKKVIFQHDRNRKEVAVPLGKGPSLRRQRGQK